MDLETGNQRLAFVGMVLGFLAICAGLGAWIVVSLSDAHQGSLGHWFNGHSSAIWGFVVGFVPSALAYVFGKRVATRQTVKAGQELVQGATDGDEAARRLQTLKR